MKNPPNEQSPTFDLNAVGESLRMETSYEREGHAARTVLRSPDLRAVLVALSKGTRIPEHRANATTMVYAVTGHLRLSIAGKTEDLRGGHVLVLERGVPHDVRAEADSTILLTLGHVSEPSP